MEIRRPVAAVLSALALFGGAITLSGCGAGGNQPGRGFPPPPDPARVQQLHDDLPDLSDPMKGNQEGQNPSNGPG
jgi:hypothetical protein